jgi:hypothetical protein
LIAPGEDALHLLMGIVELQLAAIQAADLAVRLVGAEGLVHPLQPCEKALGDRIVDIVVSEIEDDRHAHDVLDAACSRQDLRDGHARFAFRIAACNDCANP